jgi:hypothetical protein
MAQFTKFTHGQWNKVEKTYDPITKAVLSVMKNLGGGDTESVELKASVKTCGDEVYKGLRKILYENNLLDTETYSLYKNSPKQNKNKKKNKKNKKKNGLSKEEMIRQNIITRVNKNMEEVLKTFSYKKYNITYGFHSSYAEIRLVTFMYAIQYWMKQKEVNMAQCYELVLGIRKTLHNLHLLKNLSKIAISDLKSMYNKLIEYCNFSYATMFDKFPRLCLMTAYDTVFVNMSIKPYLSQQQLMKNIKDNNNAGLYCYKAMIGTGKTTFAIALSELVSQIRIIEKAHGKKSKLQLIFACSVEPVRHQVCRMAYNQKIPFGIGVLDYSNNLKVINNYSCKNDENRILIVADLETTIELLKRDQDYVLFIDEPTVGADQKDHPITQAVTKVIAMAPKMTILCSATLPETSEISPIIENFQDRYPDTKEVISVCSKESLIGCEIINFDGSTILPHNNCRSCEELSVVVNNLKEKPFIDRLYTAPIVYKLKERMSGFNIPVFDIEEYFADVDTLKRLSNY